MSLDSLRRLLAEATPIGDWEVEDGDFIVRVGDDDDSRWVADCWSDPKVAALVCELRNHAADWVALYDAAQRVKAAHSFALGLPYLDGDLDEVEAAWASLAAALARLEQQQVLGGDCDAVTREKDERSES